MESSESFSCLKVLSHSDLGDRTPEVAVGCLDVQASKCLED